MDVQAPMEAQRTSAEGGLSMDDVVRISRLRAAGTHMTVSFLIALVAMTLVFGVWYPPPSSQLQGVSKLLLVLIAVDVVIGPMITAIIFRPAKGWRLLRFDLMVIAALQTAALIYGTSAIFQGRPAYLVFSIDRFDLVQAQDVDRKSLKRAVAEGRPGLPWWGMRTVASRKPTNRAEAQDLLLSSVAGGSDLPQLPHLFVPYEEDRAQVLAHLHPLEELRGVNHLDEPGWAKVLAELDRPPAELGYVPLMGKVSEGAVVVDAKTGEIVRILTLTPDWAAPAAPAPKGEAPQDVSPAEPKSSGREPLPAGRNKLGLLNGDLHWPVATVLSHPLQAG